MEITSPLICPQCVQCGQPATLKQHYRDVCPTDQGDEIREGEEWVCDDCACPSQDSAFMRASGWPYY